MAAIVRVAGGREPMRVTWRRLALPVAVVVSAGHMTKGLAKLTSWPPFLPQPSTIPRAPAPCSRSRPRPFPSPTRS